MILYGSSFSPFVRKVLAYAAEKGIELENRPTRIGEADPDFRAASPFGKMPALVDGAFGLADSSAIIHYLETKYPEPAMIPAEAEARGRVVWFEEMADTVMMPCFAKMFFNRVVAPMFLKQPGNEQVAATAERDELPKLLDYLERTVPETGYLVGGELTLADLAVASPIANLPYAGVSIDEAFPRTAAYAARILSRPSFAPVLAKEQALLAKIAA